MIGLRAFEIHARVDWPAVLEQLGIHGFGSKKARPCPACGGRDRFVGDNRRGRGDHFCRNCGAGDGFSLLMKVHGWTFSEARRRVLDAAGIAMPHAEPAHETRPAPRAESVAQPSRRVRDLRSGTCEPADCLDVIAYLEGRALWPLPAHCALRAHPLVEYFDDGQRIGKFPALIGDVRDAAGDLVTVHVTYLQNGRKLQEREPRKLLGPLTGRIGCAVRLAPLDGDALGIAEGIETALSAAMLERVPTWAALNTSLLQRFEPPPGVRKLVVFADRDVAGLEAAGRLMERLQGRITVELRASPAPAKDWNDRLTMRRTEL